MLKPPPSNITGMLQISNSRIYGTASNLLKLFPTITRKQTLSASRKDCIGLLEKFSPYWDPNVRETWCRFLGDFLNNDPSTYAGSRKGWMECITMIQQLQIQGFKDSGLTVMQTANDLALAGIIQPPSLKELALWIWQHPNLGAFHGLERIGFHLCNSEAVLIALTSIYEHLDQWLTLKDKECLGFGTVAVEHFLCKTEQWSRKVKVMDNRAREAEENAQFMVHADERSHHAFPFPLCIPADEVQEVYEEIQKECDA